MFEDRLQVSLLSLCSCTIQIIFLVLGNQITDWKIVILDTEQELNFLKHAIGFLYSNYNQNYTLGGSTASVPGSIDYSEYIKNISGIIDKLYILIITLII